jgi:hypothetical protein
MSARMDPEDLREIISTYQKRVAEAVQRLRRLITSQRMMPNMTKSFSAVSHCLSFKR